MLPYLGLMLQLLWRGVKMLNLSRKLNSRRDQKRQQNRSLWRCVPFETSASEKSFDSPTYPRIYRERRESELWLSMALPANVNFALRA
jgi:hypothetical protein